MDLALLVLRLVVGLTFAAHGAQKLFGAFGGPGIAGTAGFFEQIGLRPGKLHAWAAGIAEFFGGLAIALGIVTPVPAAALIAVMTAAVITVHLKNGFFVTNQGYEFNLALAAALFALAGIGAGGWSLDNALGIDMTGTGWALGALGVGLIGGIVAVMSGRIASRHPREHGHPSPA
ncbi:MAG: DoxX family protein [Actinobacteria bacterium]|nr:MAG: DoxX family protein [Actinomycetota bacterium]